MTNNSKKKKDSIDLDYEKDKKRITVLVSKETRDKWQKFTEGKKKKFSTISKLIRKAVDFYIGFESQAISNKTISTLSHKLKEPLTVIKGYSHLIIENYKDKLDWDVLSKIKEVYDRSILLEKIINETLGPSVKEEIDIIIVEDDILTSKVLADILKMKDFSIKSVTSGIELFEILNRVSPRIILLDIILPETNGFEICKKIKQNEKFKNIYIYYITAIPRNDVEEMINETGADGYFLKPFNYSELDILDDLVLKKV